MTPNDLDTLVAVTRVSNLGMLDIPQMRNFMSDRFSKKLLEILTDPNGIPADLSREYVPYIDVLCSMGGVERSFLDERTIRHAS